MHSYLHLGPSIIQSSDSLSQLLDVLYINNNYDNINSEFALHFYVHLGPSRLLLNSYLRGHPTSPLFISTAVVILGQHVMKNSCGLCITVESWHFV